MRILVLGATGRVGDAIVWQALRDGYEVHALVRTPAKMKQYHRKLTLTHGNALNPDILKTAMKPCDLVISALNTDDNNTLSNSTPAIIETMQKLGKKRIITIGTAGILNSRLKPGVLRYQGGDSKRKSTTAAKDHHQAYHYLCETDLDWTIVCPTYLPDGEAVGNYRIEEDYLPENGSSINVGDVADFACQQITDDRFMQSRVGIAY